MMMKHARPGMAFQFTADNAGWIEINLIVSVVDTLKCDDLLTMNVIRIMKSYNGNILPPRMVTLNYARRDVIFPGHRCL